VCVDASSQYNCALSKGKIYTITAIFTECNCGVLINVDNMKSIDIVGNIVGKNKVIQCVGCGKSYVDCGLHGYRVSRFRPLDETFAEEVLENIKEQIKEEELILV